MRTPNSPESPDEFYQVLQERKAFYTAKMIDFKDDTLLSQYYEGRLDAILFLMAQFEIMFYEVPVLTDKG